ncbi:MAG: protein kinase [Planctomycetales bacterium]|nr:protein kinase [Planctomycetales bacterium]
MSVAGANSIFDLCDEFEDAWSLDSYCAIDQYTNQIADTVAQDELLLELIKLDLELRWQHAQMAYTAEYRGAASGLANQSAPVRPRVEFYTARHPRIQSNDRLWRDLISHEYIVRHAYGDRPTIDSFALRFPQCHQLTRSLSSLDTTDLTVRSRRTRVEPPSDSCLTFQCAACTNPIRVSLDDDFEHVTCESCGEPFEVPEGSMELPLGQIDRFELHRRLGRGGFATVWRAFDPKLQRLVALKVHHLFRTKEYDRKRFLDEATTASQLSHRNIVSVHDSGRVADTAFIVFDLVEGRSLSDFGAISDFRKIATWCRDIARGLQHAHELGIIHRDIKPDNVLIDHDGTPLITDFGLAKRTSIASTDSMTGDIKGTPAFCSPEQASGKGHHADQRCDIYSLGAVLYFLLTGKAPFGSAEDTNALLQKVIRDQPISPRNLRCVIPVDLDTICLKCLQKNAKDRYANAADLADDLDRFVASRPILARPTPLPVRLFRWCRRQPGWAALALFVCASAIAATVIAVQLSATHRVSQFDSTVASAFNHWQENEPWSAYCELTDTELCPPESRDFSWGLVHRLCNPLVAEIQAHNGSVTDLKLANDSSFLMSGGIDGKIARCNLPSGDRTDVAKLDDAITTLALSSDDQLVAVGLRHGGVIVRSLANDSTARLSFDSPVMAIHFSSSRNHLVAAGENKEVALWTIHPGELPTDETRVILPIRAFHSGRPTVGFVYGEETIAYLNEHGRLRFWSVSDKTAVYSSVTMSEDGPRGYSLFCHSTRKRVGVSFNTYVATVDLEQNPPSVCTTQARLSPGCVPCFTESAVSGVRFDSRHQSLIDLNPAAKPAHVVAFDPTMVFALETSSDGSLYASGNQAGLIRVCRNRRTAWEPVLALQNLDQVRAAVVWNDLLLCAAQTDDSIELLAIDIDQETVHKSLGHFASTQATMAISDDGHHLYTVLDPADECIESRFFVWDLGSLSTVQELLLPSDLSSITDIEPTPGGAWLASSSGDLAIVNVSNAKVKVLMRHTSAIAKITKSPLNASHLIGVDSKDGKLLLIDLTNKSVKQFHAHNGPATALAYHPNGKSFATGGDDRQIVLWKSPGEKVATLNGHSGTIADLAFTPDASTLVSVDNNREIKFWNTRTRRELICAAAHERASYGLAIDSQRSIVVSFGDDREFPLKLWRSDWELHNE